MPIDDAEDLENREDRSHASPEQNDPTANGGGGRKRKRNDHAELFRATFPMDDRAYDYLTGSSPDVQEKVIRSFRPRTEGESDYSSLITTVVKKARLEASPEESNMRGVLIAGKGPDLQQFEKFRLRFPMDDRAWEFLLCAPGIVQQTVLNDFKRPEGELDYSAAVTAFLRSILTRSSDKRETVNRVQLESFREQFPVDDRAFEFLVTSPVEIQVETLEKFDPPGFRDSDFSRPLTSYLRMLRDAFAGTGLKRATLQDQGSHQARLVLHEFRRRYPMDDRAFDYLQQTPAQVQDKVIAKFRPPRGKGDNDYSAAVTTFVRLNLEEMCPAGSIAASSNGNADQNMSAFIARYPVDDRALNLLMQAPVGVREGVVANFKPRSEGDLDYSAAVTAFYRKVKDDLARHQPQQDLSRQLVVREDREAHRSLRKFRSRYPMDDRAFDFLEQASPQVQEAVIAKFRPRSEGDADYSGAVTSFVRKIRDETRDSDVKVTLRKRGSERRSISLDEGRSIYSEEGGRGLRRLLRGFRDKYPMDDRAFDFLTNLSDELQQSVIREFRPRREGDSDYSAAVTSFIRSMRSRMEKESGGGGGGSKRVRLTSADLPQSLLNYFRQQYPMDDRAWEFLLNSPVSVQLEVVQRFKPNRENEPDYSALVTSFVRRCSGRA